MYSLTSLGDGDVIGCCCGGHCALPGNEIENVTDFDEQHRVDLRCFFLLRHPAWLQKHRRDLQSCQQRCIPNALAHAGINAKSRISSVGIIGGGDVDRCALSSHSRSRSGTDEDVFNNGTSNTAYQRLTCQYRPWFSVSSFHHESGVSNTCL